ncbi:Syntenin-1 [Cryptotermes secundus]|uniref:Syntenin-1 n=1 Tax=Cryptotermes secundus TaxID=105785 RepID=A0A2J7PQC5_9NEOP|nr:syntenin-1 [Cryptotermes secundus]PNF18537.1 Syntenin-1 [Cryptotermes secundus]
MSLYPSLEDMKVDQLATAQYRYESQFAPLAVSPAAVSPPTAPPSYPLNPTEVPVLVGKRGGSLYPALSDFMGLDLSPQALAELAPEYALAIPQSTAVAVPAAPSGPLAGMVAPLSGQSLGLQRAQVTHGIRQLTLCKDASGKVGIRVQDVSKGIFVCLVMKGSPAALAGLRFGDQILQINGTTVAGFTKDQVHALFRKSAVNGISVVVRDRPFERTVTLHKDSVGHIGFQFKNGKIIGLVKDSSAARNGLLTEHHLLEVNGQNVVGIKDKDITAIIEEGGSIITVTVIPSFIYDHMINKMATSLIKGSMDHSIPDV